jgi:hypothetical protein
LTRPPILTLPGYREASGDQLARISLAENTALYTYGHIFAACDYVIDDGDGVPSHVRRPPRPVDAFVAALDLVGDGAIVGVKTNRVDDFFAAAFSRLRARIVLVSTGSDWSTPERYVAGLDDPRILRWFGQNCDLAAPHAKFEPLPLGFAEAHWPHGDQEALLRVHRRLPEVGDKPLKAYATFHLKDSHPERFRVWKQLRNSIDVVFEEHRLPPELLWVRHANYAFEICPRGSGPDCHRIWEALLLRTIPIVQVSSLVPVFEGLPVALVEDWREVTPAAMARWQARLADRFDAATFTRLTNEYWISQIHAAARMAAAPNLAMA